MIEALAFNGFNERLGVAILLRAARSGANDFHPCPVEDLGKGIGQHRIVVADEILHAVEKAVNVVGQLAGDIAQYLAIDFAADARDSHLARGQIDDKKV